MDFVTAAFAAECGRRLQADIYRALREEGLMPIDLKKYLPGGDVLKPHELRGKDATVAILELSEKKWDDGNMSLYAHVAGKNGDRRVKVNGKSCEAMQARHGAVVEQWVGKRVTLSTAGTGQWEHITVRPA